MIGTRVVRVLLVIPLSISLVHLSAHAEEPLPRNPIPQDSPCANQPRSLSELRVSFNKGRALSAQEEEGAWVEIGYFDIGIRPHYRSLNCTGIVRGKKFEF